MIGYTGTSYGGGNVDVTKGDELAGVPFFDFEYWIARYGEASGLPTRRFGLSEGEDPPDTEPPSGPTDPPRAIPSSPLAGVILFCNEILLDLGLLGVDASLPIVMEDESIDILAASPSASLGAYEFIETSPLSSLRDSLCCN